MGLVQSILCSFSFCVERVLTWTVHALFLILVMSMLLVLVVYGISVGYHYAQRELASFAAESQTTSSTASPQPSYRRADDGAPPAVVRLLAVNKTEPGPFRLADEYEYKTKKPMGLFMDPTATPIIVMESERPPARLLAKEREIARKIISRFRRSRNMTLLNLKNESNLFRVLTWTCCAFMLMLLMAVVLVLMVYGISVGYHYAQKELASFAMSSRTTTEETVYRRSMGSEQRPIVRLVAVNRTEVERAPPPMLEVYRTSKPKEKVFLDAKETPIVVLETERPPKQPELSPKERELAKKLIGRFRRSKNVTEPPFLRPLSQKIGTESPFLRPLSQKIGTESPFLRPLSQKNGTESPFFRPLGQRNGTLLRLSTTT